MTKLHSILLFYALRESDASRSISADPPAPEGASRPQWRSHVSWNSDIQGWLRGDRQPNRQKTKETSAPAYRERKKSAIEALRGACVVARGFSLRRTSSNG